MRRRDFFTPPSSSPAIFLPLQPCPQTPCPWRKEISSDTFSKALSNRRWSRSQRFWARLRFRQVPLFRDARKWRLRLFPKFLNQTKLFLKECKRRKSRVGGCSKVRGKLLFPIFPQGLFRRGRENWYCFFVEKPFVGILQGAWGNGIAC